MRPGIFTGLALPAKSALTGHSSLEPMGGWRTIVVGLCAVACASQRGTPPPNRVGIVSTPPEPPPGAPATAQRPGLGEHLVRELAESSALEDRSERWRRSEELLDALETLADPRAAEALFAYTRRSTWPSQSATLHFRTRASFALAELGDLRAVPLLAKRLRVDPSRAYAAPELEDLRRSDAERVRAARYLAELARLHPGERDRIRQQAKHEVLAWLDELPSPHANGMRALAWMSHGDQEIEKRLLAWATPDLALPDKGALPPFPEQWVIAQSALRYLGVSKPEGAFDVLVAQLRRRPDGFDGSMEALVRDDVAMRGMALRALGVGAADGLGEWGDARAVQPLLRFVAEDHENEQARERACVALAWTRSKADVQLLADRAIAWDADDEATRFKRRCILEALGLNPQLGSVPLLMGMLNAKLPPATRRVAAMGLGRTALDPVQAKQLLPQLKDTEAGPEVALALALGSDPKTAALAMTTAAGLGHGARLQELWLGSFRTLWKRDLDGGALYRWVENALAIAEAQGWARELLPRLFEGIEYDAGPHTLTRMLLRQRLRQDAAQHPDAVVHTLELMREAGVLLALAGEPEPIGPAATRAAKRLGVRDP